MGEESRFKNKAGGQGGDLIFVKPADLSRANFEGVIAEGLLVGTAPNQFNDGVLDFKIEVDRELEIKGKRNDDSEYTTLVKKGDTLLVNGAGNLNYLMKSVSPGNLCQITYKGKKEIAKGNMKGKLAHAFEVMYE